jgi:hypothetical protein
MIEAREGHRSSPTTMREALEAARDAITTRPIDPDKMVSAVHLIDSALSLHGEDVEIDLTAKSIALILDSAGVTPPLQPKHWLEIKDILSRLSPRREPQSLGGMIAAIYDGMDAEDRALIDRTWQEFRAAEWSPDPKTVERAEMEKAEAMDDFIRAVLAGNFPRTEEPYKTVGLWLKRIIRSSQNHPSAEGK